MDPFSCLGVAFSPKTGKNSLSLWAQPGCGRKETEYEAEFKGSQNYVALRGTDAGGEHRHGAGKAPFDQGRAGDWQDHAGRGHLPGAGKKLIIWNIKSTTKAQDGLYVYDVVQRLYDSQFGGDGVDNIEKYVKLGKLGEAFTAS